MKRLNTKLKRSGSTLPKKIKKLKEAVVDG
jgi:hypothetical protein